MGIAAWTLLIGGAMSWFINSQQQSFTETLRAYARAAHEKDLQYRRWCASQGGVYVKESEATPRNPYLANPEREVKTPSGKTLTLVNPAYMTRQVHELAANQTGVRAHITSARPLRPENMADTWELRALAAFENGQREYSSIEEIDGQTTVRLMRPLLVEESCMKCHATQGDKVGQLRGGISVSLPVTPEMAATNQGHIALIVGSYGVFWILGLVAAGLQYRAMRRRLEERQKHREELAHMASHDPLTGLLNRRLFDEAVERAHAAARRGVRSALLFIDVDRFKGVNDALGHVAGDEVLRTIARQLQSLLRTEDICARLGGDEFGVLLNSTNLDQACEVGERIRRQVQESCQHVVQGEGLSVSIGIADLFNAPLGEGALNRADAAMYEAKKNGRNRIWVDDFPTHSRPQQK